METGPQLARPCPCSTVLTVDQEKHESHGLGIGKRCPICVWGKGHMFCVCVQVCVLHAWMHILCVWKGHKSYMWGHGSIWTGLA